MESFRSNFKWDIITRLETEDEPVYCEIGLEKASEGKLTELE